MWFIKNDMGLMESKIKSARALETMAKGATKPWYKKGEYWIGIIANVIAIMALLK